MCERMSTFFLPVPSPEDLEDEAIRQQPKANYESTEKQPIMLGAREDQHREPIISVEVDEGELINP